MDKFIAPVRIKIEVHIKSKTHTGVATINFCWGQLPTKEELKKLYDGKVDMMNEEEFFDQFMFEETGSHEKFAAPTNLRKFELDI